MATKKQPTKKRAKAPVVDLAQFQALQAQIAELQAQRGQPVIETTGAPVSDPNEVKLDLAGGNRPKEGYQNVDLFAEGALKVDLTSGERWPFEDNSVDFLHCSHFIEHIEKGNKHKTYTGQGNLFLFFFEEAFRIAKDGCIFELCWPALQNVRAFQDPTHCDYIPLERLAYIDADGRKAMDVDHYLCKLPCNWKTLSAGPTMLQVDSLKHEDVQKQAFREHWGFAQDFVATLKAVKALPG